MELDDCILDIPDLCDYESDCSSESESGIDSHHYAEAKQAKPASGTFAPMDSNWECDYNLNDEDKMKPRNKLCPNIDLSILDEFSRSESNSLSNSEEKINTNGNPNYNNISNLNTPVCGTDPSYRVEVYHYKDLTVADFRKKICGKLGSKGDDTNDGKNPIIIKGLLEAEWVQDKDANKTLVSALTFLEKSLDMNMDVPIRGQNCMRLSEFFQKFREQHRCYDEPEAVKNGKIGSGKPYTDFRKRNSQTSTSASSDRSDYNNGNVDQKVNKPKTLNVTETHSNTNFDDNQLPTLLTTQSIDNHNHNDRNFNPQQSQKTNKNPPLYLADLSIAAYFPELFHNRFVSVPKYFLHCFSHRTRASNSSSIAYDTPSLFVGSKGSYSKLHQDQMCSNFWMSMYQGVKKWVCFHPDDVERSVEFKRRYQATWDNEGQIWRFGRGVKEYSEMSKLSKDESSENCSNLNRKEPRRLDFLIQAGDILFIPHNTPHEVFNLTSTVAVSANFFDQSNIDDCVTHLENKVEVLEKQMKQHDSNTKTKFKLLNQNSNSEFTSTLSDQNLNFKASISSISTESVPESKNLNSAESDSINNTVLQFELPSDFDP